MSADKSNDLINIQIPRSLLEALNKAVDEDAIRREAERIREEKRRAEEAARAAEPSDAELVRNWWANRLNQQEASGASSSSRTVYVQEPPRLSKQRSDTGEEPKRAQGDKAASRRPAIRVDWRKAGRRTAIGVVAALSVVGLIGTVGLTINHFSAPSSLAQAAAARPQPVAVSAATPTAQPPQPTGASTPTPMSPDKRLEVIMGHASDPQRRFFVFSDPVCPFCKKIEPMLEKVASEGYEVHVFPTPLHQQSLEYISSISCADDGHRLAAWTDAINSGRRTNPVKCNGNEDVNARASQFFAQFGFNATPTIVNSKGNVHVGTFASANELKQFLGG